MFKSIKNRLTRKISRTNQPYLPLVNAELKGDAEESYKAAGCVFKSAHHILAGYQPKKKTPYISGIGGKKEAHESFMDTALREMIEELLETTPTPALIQEIKVSIAPTKVVQNGSYILVLYTFESLSSILKLVKKHALHSPLYDTVPETLIELIFKRKVSSKSELSHLSILPLVEHDRKNPFVDPYFIKDMPILMKE